MKIARLICSFLFLTSFMFSCGQKSTSESDNELQVNWISLFNGEDIEDWVIKISKHELNENHLNTFRVEEGLLKVRYDGYEDFDRQYGHIFYNQPFSHYILKVEYRFVEEQAPGGEAWAYRNSGAMLHSQDPYTMTKDQDFPISIEGQMLGGNGIDDRPTSNLCTPGTNVVLNGELFEPHCINSNSRTYHGDRWVTAEFMVLGDSIVHHILEGRSVMSYENPTIGGGNVSNHDPNIKIDGEPLGSGFISLQSESHPIDFKNVELLDLAPYKDQKSKLQEVLKKAGYEAFVITE